MYNENNRNKLINEEIHTCELENGLKVCMMPKKDYVKKYAVFATNYGSNDNEFVPLDDEKTIVVPEGIAHFLEHKLFDDPEGNIMNEFSKLGSYVNAYTSNTQTAYLFSCTDNFNDNLKLLIKFVQTPYFTDESVEKEKGIIEQEIRMYDDNPNWKVYSNCLRGMYVNHPIKDDIAGTVDSINKINKELLYKCYNTFYNPKNMVLFTIGDFDINDTLETIKSAQKIIDKKTTENIKRSKPDEPKKMFEEMIEEKLSVSVPLFNIGFKDYDLSACGDELLLREISTNILIDMLFSSSSEFYQSNYESGLINSTFGSQYVNSKNYAHIIIGGESNKPEEVLDRIKQHIKKIEKNGLSEENFIRTKKKLKGYHIMNLNSIEYISNNFIKYYFNETSLMKYLELLNNISFVDIKNRFTNVFRDDNFTFSVIKPL